MKDVIYDEFQDKVDEVLIRHASLLDILSKLSDAESKSSRAVIKSITRCGCLSLDATKTQLPKDANYDDLKEYRADHIQGSLCSTCREKIEEELGNLEFYVAALCNSLGISLYDVMLKEYKKINTLGKFSLY